MRVDCRTMNAFLSYLSNSGFIQRRTQVVPIAHRASDSRIFVPENAVYFCKPEFLLQGRPMGWRESLWRRKYRTIYLTSNYRTLVISGPDRGKLYGFT